jgi:NADH-quinone oxidoreductase subunit G
MEKVTININGQDVEVEAGAPLVGVLQNNDAGVPHYCYHEGLSVAGSCRLCAIGFGTKDKEGQVRMMPKMMMSCQMTASEGMVIETQSETVKQHRKEIMEFLLINHPLDCPVCDQAGECGLQDYSYDHGISESRFEEDKIKQSKKQVGDNILLYGDRCIMCTRCVRFTREISGGAELMVGERGNGTEIDIFPGEGVNDKLAGNVVDICPVGALLDKDFLFKQRVWDLQSADSICPGCSRGCNIRIDHNKGVLYRIKPRYNAEVNEHWMCDDGRYGFKFVHSDARIKRCQVREDEAKMVEVNFTRALEQTQALLKGVDDTLAVVISPAASCEEQWLMAGWARSLSEQAVLVRGPVFEEGDDETFKGGFKISKEKVANRAGMEATLAAFGGRQMSFKEMVAAVDRGDLDAVVVCGGYPWQSWCPKEMIVTLRSAKTLVVFDILDSALTRQADVVFASGAWVEKSGHFINDQGIRQRFDKAIEPFEVGLDDATLLWQLQGREGIADLDAVLAEIDHGDLKSQNKEVLATN